MIGGTLNIKQIQQHWDEILRLAAWIEHGTVTASLMRRKLGRYPRQNGPALALRELGRIERTLFILDWLQSVELRRRVHVGLNKGEVRNALARAVFFGRPGEIRDRSFEQQRCRASGLNLVTVAIVLWNTVYLDRATRALARERSQLADPDLLQYLSPPQQLRHGRDAQLRRRRAPGERGDPHAAAEQRVAHAVRLGHHHDPVRCARSALEHGAQALCRP